MKAMSEAEEIREALEKASLPDTVVEVFHQLDVDSTGDPAVWIWVVLDDAVATSETFSEVTAGIRNSVRDALGKAGIERWPYVRFRTRSEQAELAGETGA